MPALLLFLTIGCGITGSDTVKLRAQGTVTDQTTGQVAPGASVIIFPPVFLFGGSSASVASTIADAQGHYSLSAEVGSKCLGNGFGFVIKASKSTLESESAVVECVSATQQIDLALTGVVP
jgi:hypothetical protein